MKAKGYMVELTYEDGVLTAHARNKMARMAMASEPELSHPDPPLVDSSPVEPGDEDAHLALRFYGGAVAEDHENERHEELREGVRIDRSRFKAWGKEAFRDDLVLRKDQIAMVEVKEASLSTNGRMTITTTTGKHHVFHFRRKQRGDFHALADELRG